MGQSSTPNRRWTGRLWVTGTTLLISWIAYSSQYFIIWPTYRQGITKEALNFLLPFNIIVALIFVNYAVCIRTDPGRVPSGWQPPMMDEPARFCRHCDAYKPPRAHHCKYCRTCILRMDHHCTLSLCATLCASLAHVQAGPWVNSCVGHRNMAAFIRFLVLVDIGCAMHLYKVSTCAFGRSYYYADPTTSYMIILILNYATSFPVLLAVGCFTIYHLFCVLSNSTTIEGFEKEKVASLRRRGRIADDARYPFHLGIVRNLRAVFGDDIWLWCWPLQQSPGNGLHFPVGRGIAPEEQYAWPPRDRYIDRPYASASAVRHEGLEHALAPPYAQSYDTGRDPSDEDDLVVSSELDEEEEDDDDIPLSRVRRGSEGYEVRGYSSVERELLVRRYAASRGEELPKRFIRYEATDGED